MHTLFHPISSNPIPDETAPRKRTHNPRAIAARGLDSSKDEDWGLRVWVEGGVISPVSSLRLSPLCRSPLSNRQLHVRYKTQISMYVRADGRGGAAHVHTYACKFVDTEELFQL